MLSAPVVTSKTRTLPAELRFPQPSKSLRRRKAQRAKLAEAYLPLVRQVAEQVHRHLPRHRVDFDSLVQSGMVGLLEAVERYDASRGVAFADYARYRIRGEIMEFLRSLDWVSRSVRVWGRRISAARDRLAARFGRAATPEEMATELGVSLQVYYRMDQNVNEAMLLNLDDVFPGSEDERKKSPEEWVMHPSADPFTALEGKDLIEKLRAAIEQLPDQERVVVSLSYYEELTLREIGEIFGLTEGRICQIRTRAIAHLRQILAADAPDPTPPHPPFFQSDCSPPSLVA